MIYGIALFNAFYRNPDLTLISFHIMTTLPQVSINKIYFLPVMATRGPKWTLLFCLLTLSFSWSYTYTYVNVISAMCWHVMSCGFWVVTVEFYLLSFTAKSQIRNQCTAICMTKGNAYISQYFEVSCWYL